MDQPNREAYVTSIIDELLVKKHLKDVRVELSKGAKKGDNYIGEITRAVISKLGGGETHSWILKLSDSSQKIRFNVNKLYSREIFLYENIFPAFDLLQEEYDVPESGRFKHATCISTSTLEDFEFLVMEDLSSLGFTTLERSDTFTWEMLEMVVKSFANFHAPSFAMKVNCPEKYEQLVKDMKKEAYFPEHFYGGMYQSLKQCKDLITNVENKQKYLEIFPEIMTKLYALFDWKTTEPYNAVIQGDSWMKNIMFQFKGNSKVPTDLVVVDYQLSKITSPFFDIAAVLFLNTSSEGRHRYFRKIVDLYYDQLSKNIEHFGCKAEECYPRRIYEKQVKDFLLFGLVVGIFGSGFIHSENGLDIDDINTDGANFQLNERSIKQMNEIVDDYFTFISM